MALKKQNSTTLSVSNLAQIREGTVEFGDFTLVVGAQASGKSIFLQMFKLLTDRHQIFETLELHAYDWGKDFSRLLDLYYGESMSGIVWTGETRVKMNGDEHTKSSILNRKGAKESSKVEKIFYIPAQRVVTMSQGWPRPFNNYDGSDPYVIRAFSEALRVLMEREFSNGQSGQERIFPKLGKMSAALRKQIDTSIFYGASIEVDKKSLRKRIVLKVGENQLPYMTWSAGQKEFMPLLLSLYHLIPSGNIQKKENIDWVVIEEPEMGLHPRAIQTVLLLSLQLIHRGYKVVISTHSPVLLEMVWVINNLKQSKGKVEDIFKLFDLPKSSALKEIFESVLAEKIFKTWLFDRDQDKENIRDISSLDAGSDDPAISNWGGLSEFASRAVDIVSKLPFEDEI